MNDDDVTKVLEQIVPEAPSPDGWAGRPIRVARRRRRARMVAVAAVAVLALPAGVFLAQKPAPHAVPAAPGGEVMGTVVIFGSATAPELCLGAIRESYPPQCSGPALKGDFDWDEVVFEEANGSRWTERTYTVRGLYDPADGEHGSFTLTAPVREAPQIQPPEVDFPQLCDNPLAGAPEGADPIVEQASGEALWTEAAKLPLVSGWVSGSTYNFLVQGDADAAFRQLRMGFDGGLCVQSSDAPAEARRIEALDAVAAALPGQFLSGDPGSVTPELDLRVVIATPQVEATVREAVGEVPFTLTPVFTPVAEAPPGPSDAATTDPSGWMLDVHQPGEWWTQPLIPVSVVLERCPKPFGWGSEPDLNEVTGLPPGSSVNYMFFVDDYHCGIGWSEPESEVEFSRDEMTTEAGLRRICSSSGLPMDETWRFLGYREREWAGERSDPDDPYSITEEMVTAAFIDDNRTVVGCMAYLWDGHDGGAYVELAVGTDTGGWVQPCPVEPTVLASYGDGLITEYELRGAGPVRDGSGTVLTDATALRLRVVGDSVTTTHPIVDGIAIVDAWVEPYADVPLSEDRIPPIEGEVLGPNGEVVATCRR